MDVAGICLRRERLPGYGSESGQVVLAREHTDITTKLQRDFSETERELGESMMGL